MERPVKYDSTLEEVSNKNLLNEPTTLTSVNNDRPVLFDDLLKIQGNIVSVKISSGNINSVVNTILLPTDLTGLFYDGLKIYFKPDTDGLFTYSKLEYNHTYYVKEIESNLITLYYDINLSSQVYFENSGSGSHLMYFKVNPFKFESVTLLPYERGQEELHAKVTELYDYLIQLESSKPNSFEKIIGDISNKYTSYFDLSEDAINELISESGYGYLVDLGINLGTSELAIFYSYLKLIHLLKGTRQGLEFVFQLLGYEASIVEWWENSNISPKPMQVLTFDVVIKLINQQNLTSEQIKKIRVFTRFYVYPLLRFVIKDILLEMTSSGILLGGYSDKYVEIDSSYNTSLITLGGYADHLEDIDLLNPNFEAVIPYHYDTSEGDYVYISLGDTYSYLVLDSNLVSGVIIYLTSASVVDNVQFSLKKNGITIISQVNLTMTPTQNLLTYAFPIVLVQGDILTLTVETLDVGDVSVGNSILFGFYG